MKTKTLFFTILLIVISFSCGKDDDAVPSSGSDISQPANIGDPAVLPATYTEIGKIEGGFTPMLTGVIADWRVQTRIKYEALLWPDCWSPWQTEYYYGVTRDNVKGQSVTYVPCGLYSTKTYSPDCSDPVGSTWGQYKSGGEEQPDGGQISRSIGGKSGHIKRNFTIPDLPDAYVQREVKWEVVPIDGGQWAELSHGEPGDGLSKTTSTMTGLKKTETEEWGYTLGIDVTIGNCFTPAAVNFSAEIDRHFTTELATYEEKATEITISGTIPNKHSAMRLQVFREVSTFTLVKEDGSPYGEGVYAPVIAATTTTKNYIWYYK